MFNIFNTKKQNISNEVLSIFDVAKYIIDTVGGSISTMKLQKLCYYSQAWHLVWNNEMPLFYEDFEAWVNGPVCRELFNEHKGYFFVSGSNFLPKEKLTKRALNDDELISINKILDYYGGKTGDYLSALTHEEAPWKIARGEKCNDNVCDSIITKKSMYDYYSSI